MGWATGSEIGQELWLELRQYIAPANQKKAAKVIVDILSEHDADDWYDDNQESNVYAVAQGIRKEKHK